MSINRTRTLVRTAVGSTLIASALGASALGLASAASASPVNNAPQYVICQVYRNGVPVYWYYGPCR